MPLYGVITYIIVIIAIYTFRLLPEDRVEASNDAFIALVCLLGFYNLLQVSKRFAKDETAGRCWFLFSIGLLSDSIGHAVYAVQEFATNTYMSFPNIADIMIMSAQGLYIVSLSIFLRNVNKLQLFPQTQRKLIANAIVLIIVVLTSYIIIYPGMIDDTEPLWIRFMYQIYPLLDIFLSWYAIHLLLAFTVMGFSPVSKPWLVIVLGFLMFFITDSAYTYYEVIGAYHPYLLINPGWGLSYLMLSYASSLQINLMDQLRPQTQ